MIKNMGNIDRIIRLVVAVALIAAGILIGSFWQFIFYGLALVMVVTSIIGFCPLYYPLKINTTGKKNKNKAV
jgi:hypothetical protein